MWSGCGLLLWGQEDEASKASVSWRDVLIVRAVSVVVVAESSFGFEVGERQGGEKAAHEEPVWLSIQFRLKPDQLFLFLFFYCAAAIRNETSVFHKRE